MINVFNSKTLYEYKTAYYLASDTEKILFKYNKINREDYNEIDILTNIGVTEGVITIKTSKDLNFKSQDKVEIKGITYRIENIYKEDNTDENGVFNIHKKPEIYLVMKVLKK